MKFRVHKMILSKFMYSLLVICVLTVLQASFTEVYAATGKSRSYTQWIKKADLIVFGKCTDVTSEWRNNKIYSVATIQVEDFIKGDAPRTIQVEYMGGTAIHPVLKAPITMNVSSNVKFSVDEELVLLLKYMSAARYQLVSAEHGKVTVVVSSENGEKVVLSSAKKIVQKKSAVNGAIVLSKKQMNIQEFTDLIRSRMQVEKKRDKK